ncbi:MULTISPECIES: 4'-phosphopantetheinyl transferase family protein [Rhizobium]|uniref:4'-phosphopantetheinyl transferase family protein n=1 Tax=Rhizobium TaxID=379 RepID=UPI0011465AC5|nr:MULTISPECIES: 4'-phosphopantetheinyl transferase superfamily protein [Rhizobium]MCS0462904.1 4'-phosphopantetheinyl transferase superfamily protein [Rhizobium favelukesii]UFS84923.1 4'-phosphopantetheinyl transferase superfamily protein [Rhizobium sp. T136]
MNHHNGNRRVSNELVKIWQIDLNVAPDQWRDCLAWLNHEEQEKYHGLKNRHDARRFAAAHVALRRILAGWLMIEPWDVKFAYSQWRRPYVLGGPFFSMSRSGDLSLVAVSHHPLLGIDVERLDQVVEWSWLETIWSPAEWRRLRTMKNAPELLLRLWVRKEAAVKALGLGLTHPLSQVVVPLSERTGPNGARLWVRNNQASHCWRLYDLPTKGGFIGSIVTARPVAPENLAVHAFPP